MHRATAPCAALASSLRALAHARRCRSAGRLRARAAWPRPRACRWRPGAPDPSVPLTRPRRWRSRRAAAPARLAPRELAAPWRSLLLRASARVSARARAFGDALLLRACRAEHSLGQPMPSPRSKSSTSARRHLGLRRAPATCAAAASLAPASRRRAPRRCRRRRRLRLGRGDASEHLLLPADLGHLRSRAPSRAPRQVLRRLVVLTQLDVGRRGGRNLEHRRRRGRARRSASRAARCRRRAWQSSRAERKLRSLICSTPARLAGAVLSPLKCSIARACTRGPPRVLRRRKATLPPRAPCRRRPWAAALLGALLDVLGHRVIGRLVLHRAGLLGSLNSSSSSRSSSKRSHPL